MKKSNVLILAFTVFAVADLIYNFIASDGFHYFSQEPQQLLLVAFIGITGGLLAFSFSALSPRLQRGVKLAVLCSGASFVMLAGGYLSFQVASLPKLIDPAMPRHIPWILLFCTIAVAGLLWFEFYQVLRNRNLVA